MKIRKSLQSSIIILVSACILTACQTEQEQAAVPPKPVEVDAITVETQPVKLESKLPGRTSAFRVAEVRPQVNGIIKKRFFREGSEVQEGELLYQIDASTYQAAYDSAKAALAKAKAVEHSTRLKAEKYSDLVRSRAVSEIEQVEYEANWKQAQAEVAAAEANLNSARINLEYTKITAPISGRIGKSMISKGALVTAQQATALAIIQQLDPIYVDVTQSSGDLLRLRKAMTDGRLFADNQKKAEVSLLLEDGSVYENKAYVSFSDVTVDESTGSVTLRAIAENPNTKLLPGMFVRAKITRGIRPNGILIPASSISRNNKGQAIVMLVNNESKVESRIIESEKNMGGMVLVNSGLTGGEKLITAGLQNIKQGVSVAVVERTSPISDHMAMQTKQTGSTREME